MFVCLPIRKFHSSSLTIPCAHTWMYSCLEHRRRQFIHASKFVSFGSVCSHLSPFCFDFIWFFFRVRSFLSSCFSFFLLRTRRGTDQENMWSFVDSTADYKVTALYVTSGMVTVRLHVGTMDSRAWSWHRKSVAMKTIYCFLFWSLLFCPGWSTSMLKAAEWHRLSSLSPKLITGCRYKGGDVLLTKQ